MGQDGCEVAGQHAFDVELQAGELRALDQAIGVRLDENVLAVPEAEPVDRVVDHAPDDVFGDAVSAIRLFLLMEVVGDGAGGYLDDELGRPLQVVVLCEMRGTGLWSPGEDVRLDLVALVEDHRGVEPTLDLWSVRREVAEPAGDGGVRLAVLSD